MPSIAVGRNARLRGAWRAGRGRHLDADAVGVAAPEARRAVVGDGRVPIVELLERDGVLDADGPASVASFFVFLSAPGRPSELPHLMVHVVHVSRHDGILNGGENLLSTRCQALQ